MILGGRAGVCAGHLYNNHFHTLLPPSLLPSSSSSISHCLTYTTLIFFSLRLFFLLHFFLSSISPSSYFSIISVLSFTPHFLLYFSSMLIISEHYHTEKTYSTNAIANSNMYKLYSTNFPHICDAIEWSKI